MGQVQSDVADANATVDHGRIPSADSSPSADDTSTRQASMESLIAEAVAFGNDVNESLDAQAQKALECPCIADLRSGPCGTQFSEAFVCFLKSAAEEKGSDCVHPFVALQECIKAHPDAFSKDILDDEENAKKVVEPTKEYKIIPPEWTVEKSQDRKHKL